MAEMAQTVDMDCSRIDQLVEAYLDGSTAADAERNLPTFVPGASAEFEDFQKNDDWLRRVAGSRPVKRAAVPPKPRPGTTPRADPGPACLSREFGDYELLDELGRGGMGVVYRAHQRSLNRIVAIKMISSGHLASSLEVQRFLSEARLAAQLNHVGIVPVHAVGEHEGHTTTRWPSSKGPVSRI
jgi:hypothetical protein